ncbi:unnamed protein product (macronuclear) [Paramecium tetraurelia]|uniref:PPM-type phosphatase domain-containing protein n=1 Tax=Paramecium tetraurelia TaxID=5888 RepID=A0CJ39_PARTE|nr:uncharacterized protein GSPATT00038588001 [Paramecium tetraurelia]CAK70806.1 unnamed protein product [Paramecium tetraurelia]|eukprot:XP_001438203.1 hypothetical protein (macronuclear) [Paramecium tetraurelia strain d4-2]
MYTNQSVYIPKAIGVKEYAYDEEINIPYRQQMEDFYFIKDNILEDGSQSILFGIMDGHGGQTVAKFVSTNFPKVQHSLTIPRFFFSYTNKSKDHLINYFRIHLKKYKKTHFKVNELVKQECNSNEMGSTASIGFMRLEGAKRVLYFANVGDSRAFLFGDQVVPLTTDHKPNKQGERARILKHQGTVLMDRLNGILAISRAFGDHSFTQYGLTCTPDQVRVELRLSHKWVVVASDGLWDVVNEQELLQFIRYKESADEVTKFLQKLAQKRQSKDNVSILCLKIQI